jgi:hypothetical protein
MGREQSVSEGVRDAWDAYLNEHSVSIPAIIRESIEKAVKEWLDSHEYEVIEAIARTMKEGASL